MIDRAFKYIADRLNQKLRADLQYNDDLVVVSTLTDNDGALPPECTNKLILTVFNIELETQIARPKAPLATIDKLSMVREPASLDIGFLLVSNFSDYTNALAFLSRSIGFFQDYPSFRQGDGGNFPTKTEFILIEDLRFSIDEQSRIWSMLGQSYRPSMGYRARIVAEEF